MHSPRHLEVLVMFRTLIASDAPRARRGGAAAISTLLHSGLMAGAILATSHRPSPRPEPLQAIPVDYRQPEEQQRVITVQNPDVACCGEPVEPLPPIEFPQISAQIASLDNMLQRLVEGVAKPVTWESRPLATGHASRPIASGLPYDAGSVDKPVSPLSEPALRYPEMFRQSGTEGRVTMNFVVDTLGRVEPASIAAVAATHQLFTAAVRSALLQQRFSPAEVAGRRVRQLVQQEFVFTLHR